MSTMILNLRGWFAVVIPGLFATLVFGLGQTPCFSQSTGSYEVSGGKGSSSGDGTWTETDFVEGITGYETRPADVAKIEIEFFEPKLDHFGNRATFEGRLKFVAEPGGDAAPVNWFQGITVLLSNQPNASQAWANGVIDKSTLSEPATLRNDGTFAVEFNLRKISSDTGSIKQLQIGATLAKTQPVVRGRQSLTRTSKDRLLVDSTREIAIPDSNTVPHELRLIDHACQWPFEDEDGAKLIRAVNALHALGKDQALDSMRVYLKHTSDSFNDEDQIVFWILRSLFEPVDLEERSFRPMIFVALYVNPKTQPQYWPWDPMDVVDQVPFMLGGQIGGGGAPESPESHLNWFKKHGLLRDRPLHPVTNPLIAAESLLTSKKFQTIEDSRFEMHFVRRQALAMVGAPRDQEGEFATDTLSWSKYLASSLAKKTWSEEKQEFILPSNSNREPAHQQQ